MKNDEGKFIQVDKQLYKAVGYYAPIDNQLIKWTGASFKLYTYMIDAQRWYKTILKKEHFESQETIAHGCGLERETVNRLLSKFIQHGVVKGTKQRLNGVGQWRWTYHDVVPDLSLWKGSIEMPVPVSTAFIPTVPTYTPKTKVNAKPVPDTYYDDEDLPPWDRIVSQ